MLVVVHTDYPYGGDLSGGLHGRKRDHKLLPGDEIMIVNLPAKIALSISHFQIGIVFNDKTHGIVFKVFYL